MKAKYQRLKRIKKNKSKELKQIDYGLALLKVYLAFLVVCWHDLDKKIIKNKIIFYLTERRAYHVPSFYIMSFYFLFNTISSLNIKLILKRYMKLLIPYIGWALIIWKINHVLNRKYKKQYLDSYENLKIQLMWGSCYIRQLYFQWDLIMSTLSFIIINSIFRKYSIFILHILLILSYALLYSGYFFNYINNLPRYKRTPLGNLLDLFPLSVTGYTLGFYKIINYLHKYKIRTLILSLLTYNVIEDYEILSSVKGIFYPGLKLHIQCLCLIFIFSLFPSEKISNKYLSKILFFITNYTGGVYYLHFNLHHYLIEFFKYFKNTTFTGVIIEYTICYYICFIGTLIFGRTPLKFLFC